MCKTEAGNFYVFAKIKECTKRMKRQDMNRVEEEEVTRQTVAVVTGEDDSSFTN